MGSLLDYTDLVLAVAYGLMALALVVQLRRARVPIGGVGLALVCFFVIRAIDRMLDSPQLSPSPNERIDQAMDLFTLLTVIYLVTQVRRIVEATRARLDAADDRTEEYDRARRHYAQVVRHRVLNPVTVIRGTLITLRDDVAMDRETRVALCDAALAASDVIEHVSLEPESLGELEHELDAIPRHDDEQWRRG
jgi:signal transduction histidine kinase